MASVTESKCGCDSSPERYEDHGELRKRYDAILQDEHRAERAKHLEKVDRLFAISEGRVEPTSSTTSPR